jgi:glycogen debranching enzyme
MPKSIRFTPLAFAAVVSACTAMNAQGRLPAPAFSAIPSIAFDITGPVIRAHTEALKPFTVAGERGVLLGQQDGAFEAWVLPVKVLSHLTIEANVEGYSVPIDVNQQSAEIEVRPDRTVITYAHIAFTVRQIMFSPNDGPAGTGPVVLFEFDCLHPTEFTLRFTPNLEFMWPMRNEGHPGPEWVPGFEDGKELPGGVNGYYVLHADYPDLAAALTIPGARPSILAPYQERPQVHPVELKLHIDPARDTGRLYPLLMAVGTNPAQANPHALGGTLEKLNENLAAIYQAHSESYKELLANSVSIDTPDSSLNEAFQWAVVSIEQLKAKPWSPRPVGRGFIPGNTGAESAGAGRDGFQPIHLSPEVRSSETPAETQPFSGASSNPADETALVAGYYASGDSARPGFGWFFGRDSLYTLYAVNGYGDFALAKSELEFLIQRQRADGKIMHEYSQTAAAIDWLQFPYMYAAADSTPLFLLATLDYVRSSGDTAFLAANRDAIEKAWAFETGHTDTNGIYDNRQGTGWVESWPRGMPHQEVYLALLDQQASAAMAQIEDLLHDLTKARNARRRAEDVATTINAQFYDADKGCYAFSRNEDGSLDRTSTVYSALAWWSGAALNPERTQYAIDSAHVIPARQSILDHPEGCLQQLAAHTLNTDWGLRDVSSDEKIYDGMSYHQGSVWPLFTGWAALAEYRGDQPLAGYQMLMENANLTRAQDLGAATELLSGDFNVPFGRSTSHQLWSSAMVITPVLRGLFGITIDAPSKTITVNPHLPAGWDHADIRNVALPGGSETIHFAWQGRQLIVSLSNVNGSQWHLKSDQEGTKPVKGDEPSLSIPIPELEIDPEISGFSSNLTDDSQLPDRPPAPGARTSKFRIVRSVYSDRRLTLTCEGLAGSQAFAALLRNDALVPKVQVEAPSGQAKAVISAKDGWAFKDAKAPLLLVMDFPAGEGWKSITVTLSW